VTTPTELIEQMMALTEVEEFLALVHPDAEYQPRPDAPVYHGLAEIRAWAEHEAADPVRPQPLPVSVTETANRAVIRGQVRYVRGSVEKRHNVLEVAAWVVTFSDGKLRRVEAFSSWSAADAAADLEADGGTREHRIGRGLQLLVRLRPRRFALG
jgi:ketosteroid isomerase-like protein